MTSGRLICLSFFSVFSFVLAAVAIPHTALSQKVSEPTKGGVVVTGPKGSANEEEVKGSMMLLRSKLTASPEAAESDKKAISLLDTLARTSEELTAEKAEMTAEKIKALNADIHEKYKKIIKLQEETSRLLAIRPAQTSGQVGIWQQNLVKMIGALQNTIAELKKNGGNLQAVTVETRKTLRSRQQGGTPLERMEEANEMLTDLVQMNTQMASDIASKIQ